MVNYRGREYSRTEVRKYFGSLDAIAGVRKFTYDEGKSKDLSAVEFRTGTGFKFVVLSDRGLDIGLCEYRGIPISYNTPLEESAPAYFEADDDNWLRNFAGGLMVTCGLTYLGDPCEDEGEKLGLHGRISNIPAYEVNTSANWNGDQCNLKITGKVREAKTLNSNLVLEREIWSKVGENSLQIKDVVRNEGFEKVPHMILYHTNVGYPILDQYSKLKINSKQVEQRDDYDVESYDIYKGPQKGYPDTVFYHNVKADETGWCKAELINQKLQKSVFIKYKKENLPNFNQWKNTVSGHYVTGLEPSNCRVEGRVKEKECGTLVYLEPGQEKEYQLEIGLHDGKNQ